jgi:hypothetical protein
MESIASTITNAEENQLDPDEHRSATSYPGSATSSSHSPTAAPRVNHSLQITGPAVD